MARIPIPVSNPQLPRQVFTAETQGAGLARGLQEAGQDIQQIGGLLQQRQTQREISTLNAEFARANAELTVLWQEKLRTADPSDPDTAERFRQEQVTSRLAELEGKATSGEAKQHFQRLSAGLESSFLVSTEAGMANLAEVAAVQSFNEFSNQFSNAVAADPFSFPEAVGAIDVGIEGYVQAFGLSREQAVKLRASTVSDAAMAAARGRIELDPDTGVEFLNAGGFSEFLDADQTARLSQFGESLKASRRAAAEKARKDAANQRAFDFVNAARNPDGSINAQAIPQLQAQVFRDAEFQGEREIAFATARYLDSLNETGGQSLSSPAVQADFLRRAALPEGDPNRLTTEEALSNVGNGFDNTFLTNQLLPTLKRAASPGGQAENDLVKAHLATVKSALGLSEGLMASFTNSPRAQRSFNNYELFFHEEFEKRRQEGVPASRLLNPNSPDFIGATLETFIERSEAGEISLPDTPQPAITLPPQFRRINGDATQEAEGMRSFDELEALLSEGQ